MTADQLLADRYRLGRPLGAGGMSTVRLAFDTRLERHVAVKLLAEHLAHDSGFVTRFRREALAIARLVHPNIVQVFDFGSDPASGRQYIVMEHVDGPSCAELLREHGALDPAEAVDLTGQACRGLDYAHRNGVIHRDVKPGNLLRNLDGQIKLADFGIAKAAEESDITKVGSVLGTAAYLSPEQTRGEPATPASDLYALGVVVYQLLTGRLPYEGASLPELARRQETGPPPPPDALNPDVPHELAAAVVRALAPTAAQRYASAAQMEAALHDGLRGVPGAPSTEQTVALGTGEATRLLSGTEATTAMPPRRRRQPLQPLPEEPPRERAAAPSPRRSPRREAEAARRRRDPAARLQEAEASRWAALKLFLGLIVVLALAAGAIAAYEAMSESTRRAVEAGEEIRGTAREALDQLRGVIERNTR